LRDNESLHSHIVEGDEACKQWKNLRDHYVKQKKNKATTGSGARPSTPWRYFSFMTFVDEPDQQAAGL
jgi:hypothetical protein